MGSYVEHANNNISVVGVDLAKNVFQIHAVDHNGKVVVRKMIRRAKFLTFFVNMPCCLIGMEACSSSHYWARELKKLGHKVKLMAPQYVKPYVKMASEGFEPDHWGGEHPFRKNVYYVDKNNAQFEFIEYLSEHKSERNDYEL